MSTPFEWLSHELETRTSLSRLEARGTVRLALKSAGFTPEQISSGELRVVVLRVLPQELALRRVSESEQLCRELARDMPTTGALAGGNAVSALSVFERLGRLGR